MRRQVDNTRRIIQHLFELLTVFFLVKVYWVDCYLRSSSQEKTVVDKDRKLDRSDYNPWDKDSYYNEDDFYKESQPEDDDIYNHKYMEALHHDHPHSYHSQEGTYDDLDSEDDRYWHEHEYYNDESSRDPSKDSDEDVYTNDDYDYNRYRFHGDDFDNQLDADSIDALDHDSGDDDWAEEAARNRLNDYNTYTDDDGNLVTS